MSVPSWFDSAAYLTNKLAQMQADNGSSYTLATLTAAFESAGYDVSDADSMYSHFLAYGNAENVSPNAYFDADQYLAYKAAQYYGTTTVTATQLAEVTSLIADAGMTAWDHYVAYGWLEGVNPSDSFDVDAYMAAKLAQMQADDAAYTMADLVAAFQAAGLDPIAHYLLYGKEESLSVTASTTKVTVTSGSTEVTGETFSLTSGEDVLTGTADNDYFIANYGALNDNDTINGGAGYDTLEAWLRGSSSEDGLNPLITNVEKIVLHAQDNANTNANASNNNIDTTGAVSVDAGRISGMTWLQNDDSRANLIVEDVRTASNEMNIEFSNTDPGAVSYEVYFNSQYLKANDTSTSGTIYIEIMDVRSAANDGNVLENNYYDGFKFYLTAADGTQQLITLSFLAADEALYKGAGATYDTLVEAFQNALAAQYPSLADTISISVGASWTGSASTGNDSWTSDLGKYVVISSTSGYVDATSAGTGWTVSTGTIPSDSGIVTNVTTEGSSDCPLIQTNIYLDNVGNVQWYDHNENCIPNDMLYGSQAGDMTVGSMAMSGGVERFDVTVDQGSWLNSLSSTNNALRMVTVVNADYNGDGVNGNTTALANGNGYGQLYIGAAIDQTNNSTWYSNVNWNDTAKLLTTEGGAGLTDVKYFDGSAFQGELNIAATITAASNAKYLSAVDGSSSIDTLFAPDGNFRYALGSGDDTLNLTVNASVAADGDFGLVVDGGAGDDFINYAFTNITTNQQLNLMQQNVDQINGRYVELNGGTGNDTIKVWADADVTVTTNVNYVSDPGGSGFISDTAPTAVAVNAGAVTVNGGAGNDRIYVGQNQYDGYVYTETVGDGSDTDTYDVYQAVDLNAVFLFNIASGSTDIYVDDINGAQPLNNDIAAGTGSFAYTNATSGEVLQVTVSFMGHAVTVNVATLSTAAGTITYSQINEAIANAINNDDVLGALLVAKDGAGYSLMVESLVDGEMAATDLQITFGTVASSASSSATATLDAALASAYGDTNGGTFATSGGTTVDGSDAGTISNNIVSGGAGDDVIVLNVGSDYYAAGGTGTVNNFDTVVLHTSLGNDVIYGFDTNNGTTGESVDMFDVSALVTQATGSTAALAYVLTGATAAAAETGYTTAEIASEINWTLNAGDTGIGFITSAATNGTYTYTVFSYAETGTTTGAEASEITILGTVELLGSDLITTGNIIVA